MKYKRLTKRQKNQLDKLYRDNYNHWISIALGIVGNHEAASEVVGKTLLYMVNRIANTELVPIDVPRSEGYFSVAIRCRSFNFLRDSKKMITMSNFDMDKLISGKN